MKGGLRGAFEEYRRWIRNPRSLMLIMLLIVSREVVGKVLCEHAEAMGSDLQIFEPFIALCNSYMVIIIAPVFFLVMMADFPVMEGSYMWSVYRMGKVRWICSQMLMSLMSSMTIVAGLLAVSVLSCAGHISTGDRWSEVITQYYLVFPEDAGGMVSTLIEGDTYNQMSPFVAVLHTFILSVLSMVLYSATLMCGKIYGRRYLAFGVCIGIIGMGATAKIVGMDIQYIFPIANAATGGHYHEYLSKVNVPFTYSYMYFVLLIAAVLIASVTGMKRRNICRKL